MVDIAKAYLYNKVDDRIEVTIPRIDGVVSYNIYGTVDGLNYELLGNAPNIDDRFAYNNFQEVPAWIGGMQVYHKLKGDRIRLSFPGWTTADGMTLSVTKVAIDGTETPGLPENGEKTTIGSNIKSDELLQKKVVDRYKEFRGTVVFGTNWNAPGTYFDVLGLLGTPARVITIETNNSIEVKFNSLTNDVITVKDSEDRSWARDEMEVRSIYIRNNNGALSSNNAVYRIWVSG